MSQSKQVSVIGQLCQGIDTMKSSLDEQLKGTGVSTDRFIATAKTAIQSHPDKKRLENASRNSLFLAVKRAASDGLMPDGRESALIVYGDQVNYQPMVQGLVKLARQSGEVQSIGAYIVYENDDFSYRVGIDDVPVHKAGGDKGWFSSSKDRGDPIGVWAYVKLKTGEYLEPTMLTQEVIMRGIASKSKMSKNYDPKAGANWEEFWKKAAIRNILKYAPKSTAMDRALKADTIEFTDDDEPKIVEAEEVFEEETQEKEEPKKPTKRKTKAQKTAAKAVKEEPPEEEEIEHDDDGVIDVEPIEDDEDEDEEIPV